MGDPVNFVDFNGLDAVGVIKGTKKAADASDRVNSDFSQWLQSGGAKGNIDDIKADERQNVIGGALDIVLEAIDAIYMGGLKKLFPAPKEIKKIHDQILPMPDNPKNDESC